MSKPAAHEVCRARRDRFEILALTIGLALVLIAAKAILLPFPVSSFGEFARWALRLAIVAAPDICFATALALFCLLMQCAAETAPRLRHGLRLTWYVLFYVCGVYGIASIAIVRWTMVPLTLPVLLFAGGENMSSSVAACVGRGMWTALCVVPLFLLLVPRILAAISARRRKLGPIRDYPLTDRRPRSSVRRLACGLVVLFLVGTYGFVCHNYVRANWTDPNRWERRIAQSPHYVFLASCIRVWRGGGITEAFDDADESDFARPPAASRPPRWTDAIPPDLRPKNVVWIVLESVGVEYLGLYNPSYDTSPNLRRLVQEGGVVFQNAYVQSPNSCKSLASLTASVYPRLDWWLIVRDQPDLAFPTIAGVLKQHGFRTCFAHSGYWSWKDRDEYLRRNGGDKLIDADSLSASQVNSWGVSDREMFQASLDWIDERPNQPFFLFAYTIETHHPYVAREPLRAFTQDKDLNCYLNAVAQADRNIAWVMSELERRGLRESTLVVITADHGESFGQHNQRIHSFAVYEPAVHVPLVLLHPSLLCGRHAARAEPEFSEEPSPQRGTSNGRETSCTCYMAEVRQHVDIAPTIVDLLGFTPPEAWQGRHLFDLTDRRAYFFACGNEVIVGLRDGRWKYHYYVDSGFEELFDVVADPAELRNVAKKRLKQCREYKSRLGGFVKHQRRR